MTPSRATGWTFAPVASNVVDPAITSSLPERKRSIWMLDSKERSRALPKRPRRFETGQSP